MVQDPPSKGQNLPLFADPSLQMKLIHTLELQGNDRAYTVLEYHRDWASVHFEGELEPKSITYWPD
jgi:hypothetical protein